MLHYEKLYCRGCLWLCKSLDCQVLEAGRVARKVPLPACLGLSCSQCSYSWSLMDSSTIQNYLKQSEEIHT